MSTDAQVWDETLWVQATFTDPRDSTRSPVTVKGYSPLHGGRALVLFAGGHERWVGQGDVKR